VRARHLQLEHCVVHAKPAGRRAKLDIFAPHVGALAQAEPEAAAGELIEIAGVRHNQRPRVQSTLRLDSDGQASGSAGCNRFTAPARLTGDEIHLGPFATTRRLCPPEVMDQEDRYLAALAAARRFGLEGEVLRLRDEDDGELLRFIVTAAPE
jgi:heat shock protein HslJ